MADVVTIYTAAISAVAALGGATITQYIGVIREDKKARREKEERYETALRDACENVLRAAGNLRTQVANNRSFRGDRAEMTARLEKVREHAGATRLYAASAGLLAPRDLAEPADQLAVAAESFAAAAAANTDLDHGWMEIEPDSATFDARIAAFREAALAYARS
jgi:hypothetical protein